MPTPQFEETVDNSGFDKNAMPRWQMVALKSVIHQMKDVDLRFAMGMNVINQNPAVATLTEDLSFTSSGLRRFTIAAVSPGTAFIDVVDPTSQTTFPRRLEVDVKDNKRFKIAYHFVDKTTYDPFAISNQVNFNLSQIFEAQANVDFDITRAGASASTASLYSLVFELKNSDSRRPKHNEWDRLIDWSDKGADFNVYFMPWDGRLEDRPTEMLARDNHIICPDGLKLEEVERALGHEIARFLGCFTIQNEKQKQSLLFRSAIDNGGLIKFVRSGDHTTFESRRLRGSRFISKDCANTINPTFAP
jgi:hypothetical protein